MGKEIKIKKVGRRIPFQACRMDCGVLSEGTAEEVPFEIYDSQPCRRKDQGRQQRGSIKEWTASSNDASNMKINSEFYAF